MKKTLVLLLCLVLAAAILPAAVLASNNFWLSNDGNSSSVHTYPGGDATLKVVAYGDDLEGVTYQWYSDYDSELGDYAPIEGATSDTLELKNVTEYKSYRCKAWDQYGNTDYVWMYVYADNNFSLKLPEGASTSVDVAPGGNAELKVVPYGCNLEGVTYQWFFSSDGSSYYQQAEGATGDTFALENVTGKSSAYCRATDQYGNYKTLYFYVSANHFSCTTNYEYGDVTVAPGENAELKAVVTGDDLEGVTYVWYDNGSNVIEGVTGDTCVIENVTARQNVRCQVSDAYGNSSSVRFYIYVDNKLTVTPEGAEAGSSSVSLYVDPNATPTLTAAVSAIDTEGITYQWYKDGDAIEGATDVSYTLPAVTGYSYYRLRVDDKYDYVNVYFYVYVDNGLTAYPEGSGPDDGNSRTYYVEPNSTPTLKAIVSAKDMDSLSYTWYDGSWSNQIEGADTASYTIPAVTGAKTYYLTVSDTYGNSVDLSFLVRVDNGFKVERTGQQNSDYYVGPGDSLELAVSVSAKDKDGLSIQWYKEGTLIEGAAGESYTVESVDNNANYRCAVADKYGNSNTIYFYVYVDNRLTVSRDGAQNVYVAPGGSATLKVIAGATDMKGITYRWNDSNNTSSDTLDLSNVMQYRSYRCTVRDRYGNSKSINFNVYVDNGFSARPKGASGNGSSVSIAVAEGASVELETLIKVNDAEGLSITWTDDNWNTIAGATEASYTVPSVTKMSSYRCEVTDKYGNSSTAYFYLSVDNDFSVVPDGSSNKNSKDVMVPAGTDAVLKVNVTARDRKDLSIVWSCYDRTEYEYAEVARDTDTFTVENVTGYSEYRCTVTDRFDNSQTIWFYVGVDNGFSANALLPDVAVPLGESATLTVSVKAIDTEGMTFRWRDSNSSSSDSTLGTESFTVENVTTYGSYYCEVTDKYGNYETVWFYVSVNNGLTAGALQQRFYVPLGESATLTVVANAIDTEGMRYEWRDNDFNTLSEQGNTLTVPNVLRYTSYRCTVTDKYDNSRSVWFYVGVDNGFSARPEGETTGSSKRIFVPLNGSTELKVAVTATDTDGLSYQWTEQVRDADGYYVSTELPDVTGDSYTVSDVSEYRTYYCRVTDKYENSATAYFYVGVENGLELTRMGPETQAVEKGSDVTLAVSCTALDPEGITYRWSEEVLTPEGRYTTSTLGDVNGGSSYTASNLQEGRRITCTVTDKYGTELSQNFTLYIENGFSVSRVGKSSQYAALGSPLTLSVLATATETDGMTFSWRRYSTRNENGGWTDGVIVSNAGASYTVDAVNGAEMYQCTVTDKYGISQRISFTVGVENGLSIDYAQGNKHKNYVPYGSSATLGVAVTATDAEGMSYRWAEYKLDGSYYDTVTIPGETGAALTVPNVTLSREFVCFVTDKYGNQLSLWMYAGPDNGLSIRAADGRKEVAFTGEAVTLTVAVTATDAEGLSCRWDEMIPTGNNSYNTSNLDVTGTTLTVAHEGEFRCTVTDKFGNEENVRFKVEAPQGKNGLVKDDDGVYRYYKGGVLQSNYTGLVTNESGTFYVRSGILASDVSGMVTIGGEVCEIANGQLATWHTELVLYNNEWLYLNKGKIDLTYTGLAENPNGWWYVTDGHMNFDFIGLQTNENGTFYVYKGQLVTWRDESVEEIDGNLYYCYKGQLCEWFTGLVPCGSDWIYVTKGVWDRSYTGLAQNDYGWWYVFNGQLDLSYTGLAANENGTFYVYKGQLVTWHGEEVFGDWVDGEYHTFYKGQLTTWDTYPKLVYPGGAIEEWVPVIGGNLAPDFTGIAVNENGYWYVNAGHMDFDLTGLVTNADGTWYVYKGQLVTWKDGIQYIESEGKNYYIYQGQLAEWHSGDIEEDGVVYHVTDGVVTSWD